MNAEEKDLLHRHLNGDLSAAEQAGFIARLQDSPELRRALAAQAFDETLVSELVLEGRPAARRPVKRRAWIPAAIAAAMLIGLTAMLLRGIPKIEPGPSKPSTPVVDRHPERPEIADAVRRGGAFLESRRNDLVAPVVSEKRHGPAPRRTYAELALWALHRAGYPESHPMKQELLGMVKGRSIESTYSASVQAMVLAEIDPVAHHERIRLCAQLLVDSQCANGQWDYAVRLALPDVPSGGRIRRRSEGPANGDNSVTSYAVLGLQACRRVGVDVDPEVLARARAWWLQCQNADGGWGYNDSGDRNSNDAGKRTLTTNASYGSATASALAALAALQGEEAKPDPLMLQALRRGREWLAANFAVDRNPGKDPGFCQLHWLSAASRAGLVLATERFGSHDWHAEGADFLLQNQRPDGSWRIEQGDFMKPEKNDVLDTCLAILFLKRAS